MEAGLIALLIFIIGDLILIMYLIQRKRKKNRENKVGN
jgi:preprotein translocase subunit YajC